MSLYFRNRVILEVWTKCIPDRDTSTSWKRVEWNFKLPHLKLSFFLILKYLFTEAFGTTWSKHYCQYTKENRIFTMIPYTQTVGKIVWSNILSNLKSRQCLTNVFIITDDDWDDGDQIVHPPNDRIDRETFLFWCYSQSPKNESKQKRIKKQLQEAIL